MMQQRDGGKTEKAVEAVQLSSDEEFGNDMLVGVCYDEHVFDVPLLSLQHMHADEETLEAIEDWRYWNSEKS